MLNNGVNNAFDINSILEGNEFSKLPKVLKESMGFIQKMNNKGSDIIFNNANEEKSGSLLIHTEKKIRWDIEVSGLNNARLVAFEIIRFFLNSELLNNKNLKKPVFEKNTEEKVKKLIYGYDKFTRKKQQIAHISFQYHEDVKGHTGKQFGIDKNAQRPHVNYYLYYFRNKKDNNDSGVFDFFDRPKIEGHIFWQDDLS